MHTRLPALAAALVLAGCGVFHGGPVAYRTDVRNDNGLDCSSELATSDETCARITPEISRQSNYTLHVTEFDDEGWVYPGPGDAGYRPEFGRAHEQVDAAIADLEKKLGQGPVLLIVYIHGWKHTADYRDSDVQKFREILTDAANADRLPSGKPGADRRVVGIYVGWRGSMPPHSEPLSNLTFWARKDTAMRVASGSVRELFARIRGLRGLWHPDHVPGSTLSDPRLRSIVIGHSFGAQIAFASLSPSIFVDLTALADNQAEWRSSRLRQTTDLVVLVNPAFEASAYEPIDRLARRFSLRSVYEPPVLVTVTSEADVATGRFFPIGRWLSTLAERPFVSAEQRTAVLRTPGFVETYRTHTLTAGGAVPAACAGWRDRPAGEQLPQRSERGRNNVLQEIARHQEWRELAAGWSALPPDWSWDLCGGARITRLPGPHPDIVWNVQTVRELVPGHNEITGDPFVAFIRQIYLDVMYPPVPSPAAAARQAHRIAESESRAEAP